MNSRAPDRHIIWSDVCLDLDDWREGLSEDYPGLSDDEMYRLMFELNGEYLEDERANLNIKLPQEIIAIADLGLWDGRVSGYKEISSGNIRDCLYSDTDMTEWYVDRQGDLRADAIHHDGTNHYLYRVYRDSTTEAQKEQLRDKLRTGRAGKADVIRMTRRLGDEIGKVYGWDFPDPPAPVKKHERNER